MSWITSITTPIARMVYRIDQAVRGAAGRVGITRELMPETVMAPSRWAARKFVRAGAWADQRSRDLYARLRGRER